MRNILIVGAGKSSPYLIKYLLDKSQEQNLYLNITDVTIDHLLHHKKNNRNFNILLIYDDFFFDNLLFSKKRNYEKDLTIYIINFYCCQLW